LPKVLSESQVFRVILIPMFKIDDEIAKDNRVVWFTLHIISAGLSFVIGAGMNLIGGQLSWTSWGKY
jgi:hypothetical protein